MQQNIQKFINQSIMSIFSIPEYDLEPEETKALASDDFQLSLPDLNLNKRLSAFASKKETTNQEDENSCKSVQMPRKINTDRVHVNKKAQNQKIPIMSPSDIGFKKDQLTFEMKFKIICFFKLLNKHDQQTINIINSLTFQGVLDLLFSKTSQFINLLEYTTKNLNEKIKSKENQILLLKTKQTKLQQQFYNESKKWSKSQLKYTQEFEQHQKCLIELKRQTQDLRKDLQKAQQIIREQNDKLHIKQNLDLMTVDTYIEIYKKQLDHKNQRNEKNNQQLIEQIKKLNKQLKIQRKANSDLNQQINQILEQNKLYKCQSMFSKQKADKIQTKLEQNEDKLIAYYQMYNREKQDKQNLRAKIKQLEKQKAHYIQQSKVLKKQLEQREKFKSHLQKQLQIYKKQKQFRKIQNEKKEQNITKLNQQLHQVLSIYKSKTQEKKQDQFQTSYSNLSSSTSSINLLKKKSRKQHDQQQCQMKLKKMIEQWKQKIQEIVLYYEDKIKRLESQLSIKNQSIARLQKGKQESIRSLIL